MGLNIIRTGSVSALVAKQDKLTGQPGQVVGFDDMGLAYAVRGWSNRNLLDNWYFPDPVNQKNVGSGTLWGTNYRGIDRWMSFATAATKWVKNEGIWLLDGNSSAIIEQRVEHERIPNGSVVTFSALANGQVLSAAFQIDWSSGENQAVHFNLDEVSVMLQFRPASPGDEICTFRVWKSSPDGNALVTAAKLELGTVQTLAHQNEDGSWVLNDPPPDKTLELLKCQRYFQVFSSEEERPVKAVDFRPTMRANPTLGTIKIDGATYYTADADL